MKYVMHMSDEDLEKLMDSVVDRRVANIEKSLAYLTEQRDNELLKMPEVCKKLQVTDRTIRTWVKKKKLRCLWIEGCQYFRMKDIMDAMETNF